MRRKNINVAKLKEGDRFVFIPSDGVCTVISLQPSGNIWKITYSNDQIINPPGIRYCSGDSKVRLLEAK